MTSTKRARVEPYITADGSVIRELFHPDRHGNRNQSLAEATIEPGSQTRLHRHLRSEEIYHVLSGTGDMVLGKKIFTLTKGDTVCIPPGTPHKLINAGTGELVILCACSPAYSHADTELIAED